MIHRFAVGTAVLLGLGVSTAWALDPIPSDELLVALDAAPAREGPAPRTTFAVPHQQLDQNAPPAMQEALLRAVDDLPGVRIDVTPFSLGDAKGWFLEEALALGPAAAFLGGTLEYSHQHQSSDGSMHLLLPAEFSATVMQKGWGVLHPSSASIAGPGLDYVMVFGPRDEAELETIWIIAQVPYANARGLSLEPGDSSAVMPQGWGRVKALGGQRRSAGNVDGGRRF